MRLTRGGAVLTILACALPAALGTVLTRGKTAVDGRLYDAALGLRRVIPANEPATPDGVVVVGVDARSLDSEALAPYPRAFLGPVWSQTIEALRAAGATVVAFDLVFAYSANRFKPGFDRDLLQALARHREHLVLGRTADSLPARPFLAALRFDEGALGLVEVVADADGVHRRIPMRLARAAGAGEVRSIAGATLARAGVARIPDEVLLAPRRHLERIPGYALIDVLDCAKTAPDELAQAVAGRIVFVGTVLPDEDRKLPAGRFIAPATAPESAASEGGCRLAPLPPSAPGRQRVPGVYLHAAAAQAVLDGKLPRDAPIALQTAAAGVAAALGAVMGLGLAPLIAFPLAFFGAVLLWLGEVGLLGIEIYYPTAAAIMALLVATFVAYVVRYMIEERRRRHIQQVFGQYLAPELVRRLAEAPEPPRLGGERREMTFLFCDVRDFTTISERYQKDPQGLTLLINRFLTAMTGVILSRGGTIDKFIGDCIVAFWNAPLNDPAHRQHACDTALAMRAELERLNRELAEDAARERRDFEPLRIGIGINSGTCVVGNMGSDQRFDYTVLGDAVNLAARLEGLSKTYGIDIVLGAATAAAVNHYALLELDLVAVKGKSEAVQIYTLLGSDRTDGAFEALAKRHGAMLAAYRKRGWAAAAESAKSCRASEPRLEKFYDLYLSRIGTFAAEPPPAEWTGVYAPEEK